MSYSMSNAPDYRSARRRPPLFGPVVVGIVALLVATVVISREGNGDGGASGFAPPDVGGPTITWVRVGTQSVPESPRHGPAHTSNGVASGFSHDQLGAVLAAFNISVRLTGLAGPAVYETTARLQCLGDIDTTIATIRSQRSTATAGTTVPTAAYYRITSGDPSADLVGVTIALDTPQSRDLGGYSEATRTMQWVDGDWKMHVPPPPPRLITSVQGWSTLGPVSDA